MYPCCTCVGWMKTVCWAEGKEAWGDWGLGPGVMEGGVGARAEYICCCGGWLAKCRAWAAAAAAAACGCCTGLAAGWLGGPLC